MWGRKNKVFFVYKRSYVYSKRIRDASVAFCDYRNARHFTIVTTTTCITAINEIFKVECCNLSKRLSLLCRSYSLLKSYLFLKALT
jgi:hypothetical protein